MVSIRTTRSFAGLAPEAHLPRHDTSRVAEPSDEDCGGSSTQTPALPRWSRASPSRRFSSILRDVGTRDGRQGRAGIGSDFGGNERKATMGDPTLLDTELTTSTPRRSRTCCGPDFARSVFLLKPGPWAGPVKSGYGVHLVADNRSTPRDTSPIPGGQAEGPGGVATPAREPNEGTVSGQAAWRSMCVVIDDSVSPSLPASPSEPRAQ